MNGVTCLRTIKSINQFRNIPVYILSTSDNKEALTECIKLGAAGYYAKPILIKDLEILVQDIVRRVEVSSDASRR
jgi:CheY-like chemotaxis protein